MIEFDVVYNKLDSPSLLPFLEAVSLTEVTAGKASTLSLSLCNADGRFTGAWAATKGDSVAVRMPPAGLMTFAIKKISVQASPRVVTWEAEARPSVSKAPKDRGSGSPPPSEGAVVSDRKSWAEAVTNVKLSEIARRVCAECGLSLKYCAKNDPMIGYAARYDETGFHLLTRLARRFGLGVRASAGTVSIIGATRSEDSSPPAAVSFPAAKIISVTRAELVPPASVKSARLDPRKGSDVRFSSGDGDGTTIALPFDADASEAIYGADVANGLASEMRIVPTPGIVAGSVLDIDGYGLREVTEMRYNRTGDTETMTILTRAAR